MNDNNNNNIIIKVIIIIIIIIIIKMIIFLQDQEILGGCPAGDSHISWGEGLSLGLVDNASTDGVSITILVWRHLKPSPQLL